MTTSPDQRRAPPLLAPRTGTWDWDVVTGVVTWDEPMERIFGFPPGGFDGRYDTYLSRLHPDDRPKLEGAIQHAVATATGHHIEHRVILPDGTIRWLEGSGRTVLDDEGRVVRMTGVATDITEQKEVERAAAFLAALVTTSDDAILAKELDGTIVSWNHAAERLYGYTAAEAIGCNVSMIMPEERRGELDKILEQIRRGQRVEHLDTVRQHKDGTLLDISVTISPILDAAGNVVAASAIAREIGDRVRQLHAERAAAEREARLQAVTAALSEAVTPAGVIDVVLRTGASALGATRAVVALLDDATDSLKIAGSHGYDAGQLDGWHDIPMTAHVPLTDALGWANLVTISSREEFAERYGPDAPGLQDGTESLAAVPLAADRSPVGVIGLAFDHRREFGAGERTFLTGLARQCAQALERARLYELEHQARLDAERARAEADAARRRVSFLADVSATLVSSLDYDETLAHMASALVPDIADWCTIDLVAEDGTLRRAAFEHAGAPDADELAAMARTMWPIPPSSPIFEVLRTGTSRFVPDATDEVLRAAAGTSEQYEVLRNVGFRSGIVVPLASIDRTFGALTVATAQSGRRYSPDDVVLVEELARRAAIAVENARLYSQLRDAATRLQASLLPRTLPDIPGVELAARYLPADQTIDVGGDFYDVFPVSEHEWGAVVGDVCGRGVDAAGLTALARHTLRSSARPGEPPSAALRALNGSMLLQRADDDRFLTAVFARLSPALGGVDVTVACSGHPFPYIVRRDGSVEAIGRPGTLLGMLEKVSITDVDSKLRPGETLVLYTDGLTEARGPSGFLGERGLQDVLRTAAGRSASGMADEIIRRLRVHHGIGEAVDDVAVLVIAVPVGYS